MFLLYNIIKGIFNQYFLIMFWNKYFNFLKYIIFLLYFCIYIQFGHETMVSTLTSGCGLTPGTNFWSRRRNKIFTGVGPRPSTTHNRVTCIPDPRQTWARQVCPSLTEVARACVLGSCKPFKRKTRTLHIPKALRRCHFYMNRRRNQSALLNVTR
jgi:hypothetical protein